MCARIPVRTERDDRYFTDTFQQMPRRRLHRDVRADARPPQHRASRLGTDYEDVRRRSTAPPLVWTGPIDEFFDYRSARCPTAACASSTRPAPRPAAGWSSRSRQINYPNERIPYTRVTEFRHLTGQVADFSTLAYEFPTADGDPYYPIPRPENRELYHRYEALAAAAPGRRSSSAGSPVTST